MLERIGASFDLLKGGRDVDPRQQTIRATIAWSHDLLGDDERILFARLGVFAGSCTLEAAEEVAGAELEVLESLIDKSLVRLREDEDAPARYWMLETIRVFAVEQLEQSGEAGELRARHAEWYARYAIETGETVLEGMGERVTEISREITEIRAALEYLSEHGPPELFAAAVVGASFHWYFVTDPREGLAWIERAASLAPSARVEATHAMFLLFFDPHASLPLARASAEQLETAGDAVGGAFAWVTVGNALGQTDFAAADAAYERSYALAESHGLERWIAGITGNRAILATGAGDLERAEELAERIVSSGAAIDRVSALGTLAYVHVLRGDPDARERIEQALREARLAAPAWRLWVVATLARFEVEQGDPADAAVLRAAVDAIIRSQGIALDPMDLEMSRTTHGLLAERLSADTLAACRALGETLSLDDVTAIALGERERPPVAG